MQELKGETSAQTTPDFSSSSVFCKKLMKKGELTAGLMPLLGSSPQDWDFTL